MQHVLITGGTGMLGTRLTEWLLQNGMQVSHLSRYPNPHATVKQFQWNYKTGIMDPEAIQTADAIINLAGAGIADHRWTPAYKKEIYDSRILGTRLLVQSLKQTEHRIKTIIQISAIGIYRQNLTGPGDENTAMGNDFLAKTCMDWENELIQTIPSEIRTVVVRTGTVLSPRGGFLKKLYLPFRFTGGVYFGNGTQQQSWIHIDDWCAIMMHALKDLTLTGTYNAVSPNPIDQKQMMQEISRSLHRRLWLPPVPAFALRWILGELTGELLASHALVPDRLLKTGYHFQYPEIKSALKDIYPDKKN
ncbi:MAG: TIGR01777 family oxidoreductase [Bacteroidia bacterium]|jgi:hypothetical protein